MPSNIFFLVLAVLVFVMVFAQVRNQKMKEKYAALWLLVSAAIIVLAIFPYLLEKLASFAGVVTPVNLLFMLAIVMLIGICMYLTLDLSRLGEDARTLAEEVAILRAQLEQGEHRAAQRQVSCSPLDEESANGKE